MEAPGFKKHLVLSLGEHTYLYLATGTHRLSEGHCYIVPMRHTPASTVSEDGRFNEAWGDGQPFATNTTIGGYSSGRLSPLALKHRSKTS